MKGWIGVDFDGTLSVYGTWVSAAHTGQPIEAMVARVKAWLAEGQTVKVFTARIWPIANWQHGSVYAWVGSSYDHETTRIMEAKTAAQTIDAWCHEHIGQHLPITCVKDFGMIELWDDRAVQVRPNTGQRVGDAL